MSSNAYFVLKTDVKCSFKDMKDQKQGKDITGQKGTKESKKLWERNHGDCKDDLAHHWVAYHVA